jgi:hypothetical protein
MPLADDKAATSEAAGVVDGSAESGDNAAVYSDDGDDDDMDTYVPGTEGAGGGGLTEGSTKARVSYSTALLVSVADPDPSDPYVFGLSGSGSFYHRAKIVRKALILTVLLLLFDFLSLKK